MTQSRKTWNKIKQAEQLSYNLDEEYFTDFNLFELTRRHPLQIETIKFSKRKEGKEGADWEWWLVSPGTRLGLRVRAKKLSPKTLRYKDLNYITPSGYRQIDLLIRKAINGKYGSTLPMYVLYNFWDCSTYFAPWLCMSRKRDIRLLGCGIVDARALIPIVNQGKDQLQDVANMMYPWSCLICCTGYSADPNAHLTYRAFDFLQNVFGKIGDFRDKQDRFIVKEAPWYVEALLEGEKLPEELEDEIGVSKVTIVRERLNRGQSSRG
jgi:hypothetical protein